MFIAHVEGVLFSIPPFSLDSKYWLIYRPRILSIPQIPPRMPLRHIAYKLQYIQHHHYLLAPSGSHHNYVEIERDFSDPPEAMEHLLQNPTRQKSSLMTKSKHSVSDTQPPLRRRVTDGNCGMDGRMFYGETWEGMKCRDINGGWGLRVSCCWTVGYVAVFVFGVGLYHIISVYRHPCKYTYALMYSSNQWVVAFLVDKGASIDVWGER